MLKSILILVVAVLSLNSVSAQKHSQKTITGRVTDLYSGPIAKAIIMVDNQKTNSVTDSRGNYKVKIDPGASTIGVFTFGIGTIEDSIKGRNVINFNFKVVNTKKFATAPRSSGEEGVNTGYSPVKRKNTTTEITSVDGTDKKYDSYSSIYEMIQRESSGVDVKGHDIVIQGSQNMLGTVPPLFVVDGTYVDDISTITPSSVKSIEVLKGTSPAIYGSRGYGGAIVIKTKLKND